jgi:hypothetical protein
MNWNDETALEVIELYAESQGYVCSESELSEKFDQWANDTLVENDLPAFAKYSKEYQELDLDECMLSEMFNNWADMLCKEGEIHQEQYSAYTYVGKYA